jgi:hypothetical protein
MSYRDAVAEVRIGPGGPNVRTQSPTGRFSGAATLYTMTTKNQGLPQALLPPSGFICEKPLVWSALLYEAKLKQDIRELK